MKQRHKNRVKNYYFPVPNTVQTSSTTANQTYNIATGIDQSPKAIQRNLGNIINPVQLERLSVDLRDWRMAINEAEQAYYPHRVRMQRMFLDTELNGHVFACMERRKELNLLRKYEFYTGDMDSTAVDNNITNFFRTEGSMWFQTLREYIHDGLGYGYQLISLGDIEQGKPVMPKLIKRWNISPDREQVTSYIYSLSGLSWNDPRYSDYHIWVQTPTTSGASSCGYGYLYKVALYEILLRNILGYNADFVELYSQPYRVGKTSKTTEGERAELEAALQAMGSNGWAVIDPLDTIEFLETNLGGTGWQGYDNFEKRLEAKISKVILGHADALDSVPGKLGNDGEKSPAQKALDAKQAKDAIFEENVINTQVIPKLRDLGVPLPEGLRYRLRNDAEVMDAKAVENKQNAEVATIAQTMKNAGLKMDAKYFTERTGIPCTEVAEEEPKDPADLKPGAKKPTEKDKQLTKKMQARLERIYGGHNHE